MASSLALDERALILAPPPLAAQTSHLLSAAGIDCLCATDLAHLHARLAEGAGLAIIAEQVFNAGPSALLQAFIDQQPHWSDLPIVLVTQGHGRPPACTITRSATLPCWCPLSATTNCCT